MIDSTISIRLRSVLFLIWLHPHAALIGLTTLTGWSWSIPLGLALSIFYLHFFIVALLGAQSQEWVLVGGVVASLVNWPVRAALLYGLSKWWRGRPDFFILLILSAWTTLPLTLRNSVQVIYMLSTGKLVTYPGLSGLQAEVDATAPMVKIGRFMLGWLDLFTVWHLVLLVLVVSIGAQVSTWKAIMVVALYSILILIVGSIVTVL